jgi:hypothetical protein
LLAEHSERVTETSSGLFAKSLVKSVIIGDVPDRGGRATSMRTKISSADTNNHSQSAKGNNFMGKSKHNDKRGGGGHHKNSGGNKSNEDKPEVTMNVAVVGEGNQISTDVGEASPAKSVKREGDRSGHGRGKKFKKNHK